MDGGIRYFDILFLKCGNIGYVLWAMSVVTLAMIVKQLAVMRRGKILPDAVLSKTRSLFAERRYREAMDLAAGDSSVLGRILYSALAQSPRGVGSMNRAVEDTAEKETARLLREVEWLNLLGNIGPMLGLMGTVWGMMVAFFTIVEKGGIREPKDIAGAIGIKLVCTLLGLVVAIPALSVYGILRNRIEILSADALAVCQELIGSVATGKDALPPSTGEQRQAAAAG